MGLKYWEWAAVTEETGKECHCETVSVQLDVYLRLCFSLSLSLSLPPIVLVDVCQDFILGLLWCSQWNVMFYHRKKFTLAFTHIASLTYQSVGGGAASSRGGSRGGTTQAGSGAQGPAHAQDQTHGTPAHLTSAHSTTVTRFCYRLPPQDKIKG